MSARPTQVQAEAIRTAITFDRVGDASVYADRTLLAMQRSGWITRPDTYTYRVTALAARAVGLHSLADEYESEDRLASDPKARLQEELISRARAAGLNVFSSPGVVGTVSISVESLNTLLAALTDAA